MRHIWLTLVSAAALTVFMGAGAMPTRPAAGSSFIVDTTVDAVDSNPGDGVCAAAGGACSLRGAIQEANALSGPDSVQLLGGSYTLTIPGGGEDAAATGDLDVTDDLIIESPLIVNGAAEPGTVIDGGGLDRVLHFAGQVVVDVSGVRITHGSVRFVEGGGFNTGDGGAILVEAGAMLSVRKSSITQNKAEGAGGAIFNGGILGLTDSKINENDAVFPSLPPTGTIPPPSGGGIMNTGSATLRNATLADNTALIGGGIDNAFGGNLTLTNVEVGGNSASHLDAGGLANFGSTTIIDSTFRSNTAEIGKGGGIGNFGATLSLDATTVTGNASTWGGGIFNNGTLALANSTVTGNNGRDNGGGIMNVGTVGTISSSTIYGNWSASGGGLYNGSIDGLGSAGSVTITNSLIAGSTLGGNCVGPIISAGHNLDSDLTCGLDGAGDQSNVEPVLGPLTDNGGPAPTHALLAGSPAIDAGDNGACPETDQRGIVRPIDGDSDGSAVCDIGAYEAAAAVATATPNATPSPGPSPAPMPAALPPTGGRPGSTSGRAVAGSAIPAAAIPVLTAASVAVSAPQVQAVACRYPPSSSACASSGIVWRVWPFAGMRAWPAPSIEAPESGRSGNGCPAPLKPGGSARGDRR